MTRRIRRRADASAVAIGDILDIVTEAQLQRTIEGMLDWAHLLHFHDEDARRDNAGLPDLIFPRAPILHVWELKTEHGYLEPAQVDWGAALEACTTVDYRVIRPRDSDWVKGYLGFR